MKKLLFVSILMVLSCLALRAQITKLEFINISSSDTIAVSVPGLSVYDLVLPKSKTITREIKDSILENRYEISVYYPLCKNTEKTYMEIGKVTEIGDLVEPCTEVKLRKCNFSKDLAPIILVNGTEDEISISDGPLKGWSLKPGQESSIVNFQIGRHSLPIERFIDPSDHNKGFKKGNFNFFAIQDVSCISKVTIKIIEEIIEEDLKEEFSIRVKNNTDRNITFGDSIFKGVSVAPGKEISDCKVKEGFFSVTINFLDNKGDKKTVILLKHLVKGDKVIITQKDLEVEAIPKVKNYRNGNRYYRNYYNVRSY